MLGCAVPSMSNAPLRPNLRLQCVHAMGLWVCRWQGSVSSVLFSVVCSPRKDVCKYLSWVLYCISFQGYRIAGTSNSTLGLFVWLTKFSRYVIRVTGHLIRVISPRVLFGCTTVYFIPYTVWVSIVRLLKYDHQHPLIVSEGIQDLLVKSLMSNIRGLLHGLYGRRLYTCTV